MSSMFPVMINVLSGASEYFFSLNNLYSNSRKNTDLNRILAALMPPLDVWNGKKDLLDSRKKMSGNSLKLGA